MAGKKIILLEPRRLAARSVAQRMAELLGEPIGQTIGYRIRFETNVSDATRIEVVTEGILTRMLQSDNALAGVGAILFDEFHERSLQADLALALCYQCQQVLRDDLRIIIMSATLDGEKISQTFDGAPIVTSQGKNFPVNIRYVTPAKDDRLWIATAKVIRKALQEQEGDVLVFLPGVFEINKVRELLESESLPAHVAVLYGDLPFQQQREAILPRNDGGRKIVLSTSIAETSLTIEGITVVVDSGYSRVPRYDPRSGLTRLETIPVTKDAADQRAGRAGRLMPGVCYRLWAESMHQHLLALRSPEILEADLSSLVLELAQWGATVSELKWLIPPPAGTVKQASDLLEQLEALANGKITSRGMAMAKLPTHPRLAHMFLVAESDAMLLSLATDVAAVLEERDPLPLEISCDLSLRVEALRKKRNGQRVAGNGLDRIERLATSWRKLFKLKEDNTAPIDELIGQLIAEAYPERIARQLERHGVRYKLSNGRVARLPEHDPLMRCSWLAIAHLDAGSQEGRIFLAAPVNEQWLLTKAKEFSTLTWDSDKGMVVANSEKRIGNVVLSSRPLTKFDEQEKLSILCQAVQQEGLKLLGWSDVHDEWQARVMSLRHWRPDENWPDVREKALLNTCTTWLSPFLLTVTKRSDFLRLNLSEILTTILPWDLQTRLDSLVPTRLEVPSGSAIKIQYSLNGEAPVVAVRLQEVFGLQETPTVNEGRNKVVMHLLSPGFKPVQVTQDLKSFWHSAYHEVRKELRTRYPKHHWPEDPWTAEAVRGVKRRK